MSAAKDAELRPPIERYRHAKALAMQLLDLAPAVRAEALDAVCSDDEALRGEVLWLLDAAEDSSHDAPAPAPAFKTALLDGEIRLEAPLPRDYRLLRRIGEGGMGVVYLAERIDGELRQPVALKLLHPLPDSDPVSRRRFATERRILSTLDHPNIARMIDGGVTAGGRPFLAMEYVDGERIDHYCDRHDLGLRQRATLFLKVCAAVEHAHRRLVIHRDIKPSNILVDTDGAPKLLDFGIARLLDDSEAERTGTGLRALTLAYASPEQIEGLALGTATDIYSLGALLYQLVAGTGPFERLDSSHLLTRSIVAGDLPAPSRRAREHARSETATGGQAFVARRVPSDIDAIVLKAMRREPEQRYLTASALAADLHRFLDARPVRARQGSWGYALRRFVWRRRLLLSAASVLLVVVALAAADHLRQQQRLALERDRAQAIVQFMDAMYQSTDSLHLRGEDVTVRQMLDLGAAGLRERRDLSPGHHAALLLATGRAYNALGRGEDAIPLLEQARDLLGPNAGRAEGRADQRADLQLALAAAYSGSRQLDDAIAADSAALQLLQADPQPDPDRLAQARIRWLHNHAVTLDMPLAAIRDQLESVLAELDARPDAPAALKIAAWRAMVMAHGGDGDAALAAAENAVRIAEALYPQDDPRLLPVRSAYLTAVHERNPERAAELLPDLIEDHERRMGPSVRVAALLSNLGMALTRIGRPQESIPVFERAAAMAREVAGENSQLYRMTIANFASVHMDLDDGERAVQLVHTVLPGLLAEAEAEGATEAQVFLAASRETLAAAALLRNNLAKAEDEFAQAAEGLARIEIDAYPVMYARLLTRLALVQQQRGRDAAAATTLVRLEAVLEGRDDAAFERYRLEAQALRQGKAGVLAGSADARIE